MISTDGIMAQIATKFVKWDVPELATLQDSRVYKLRERLKQYGHIGEYYAIDKTALRSMLYGRIEVIVEVNN